MKTLKEISILILAITLVFVGCKKKDDPNDEIIIEDKICGVEDPATELSWLVQIISLAETDISADYFGTIYLISDEEKEVFWINMIMEVEQLNGHWFNCDGSQIEVNQDTIIPWPNPVKIIYAKYETDLAWEYPTNPESIEDFQIPKIIVAKMSSTNLVEACLNYPFIIDILSFNLLPDGIRNLKEDFNGFNELLLREDAAILLLEEHKKLKPSEFNVNWFSVLELVYIEIFLSQPELLSALNKTEKKDVVKYLLNNIDEKKQYPQIFGELSYRFIGLCLIRILEQEDALINIPPDITYKELTLFSKYGNLSKELLTSIILLAENYIEE